MPSFHRKMGCINKRERGVQLWSLIGRCVKHFGAQVTDMIEFGSGAIVCRLPAGRQESALMCISDLRACARSLRSSLHLCAHTHCLWSVSNEKKRCAYQRVQLRKSAAWGTCSSDGRVVRATDVWGLGRSDCNFKPNCRLEPQSFFSFNIKPPVRMFNKNPV